MPKPVVRQGRDWFSRVRRTCWPGGVARRSATCCPASSAAGQDHGRPVSSQENDMDISTQIRPVSLAVATLLLAAVPAFAFAAQETPAETTASVQVEIGDLGQMREFKRMHGS